MKIAIRRDRNGKDHEMVLIGEWMELVSYYKGDDGNAWSCHFSGGGNGKWVNEGELDFFRKRFDPDFKGCKLRGRLFDMAE